MVLPILIPSKNRPNSKLFAMLRSDNLLFNIVVEPQDRQQYIDAGYSDILIILPENDQGLPYARNFILNYCRSSKIPWFWMLDDDISNFYELVNSKNVKIGASRALEIAETFFKANTSIGQVGLEYQQFSWSQKKDFHINSYCDVCVCINTAAARGLKFRESVLLKLDRDFTLQILANGYKTLKVSKVSFACPKNGSNVGGLYDVYKSGVEKQNVLKMCELWGEQICTPQIKPDGRFDVKINWKYFKV